MNLCLPYHFNSIYLLWKRSKSCHLNEKTSVFSQILEFVATVPAERGGDGKIHERECFMLCFEWGEQGLQGLHKLIVGLKSLGHRGAARNDVLPRSHFSGWFTEAPFLKNLIGVLHSAKDFICIAWFVYFSLRLQVPKELIYCFACKIYQSCETLRNDLVWPVIFQNVSITP